MIDQEKRDAMIEKVRALWARADHPNTPEAEADTARRMAAELMAKYEIDAFVLDVDEHGVEPPIVFANFMVDEYEGGKSKLILPSERILLCGAIARHFECRGVVHEWRFPTSDAETGKPLKAGQYYECIGYAHDVDMVRMLFANLCVDMLTGVFMEQQSDGNYRQQYARGYVERIDHRLAEFYQRVKDYVDDGSVSDSVALAIRSRLQRVQDKFMEKYPPGSLSNLRMKSTKYDGNARQRGGNRADGANIGQMNDLGGKRADKGLGQAKKELNG